MTDDPLEALRTVSLCFKEIREILESFKTMSSADLLSELKFYKTVQGMSFSSRLNSTMLQLHDSEKELSEHFLPNKYASGDLSIFNGHQFEMADMFLDWHRDPKLKEKAKETRDAVIAADYARDRYRNKFKEISDNAARAKNILLPTTTTIFSRTRAEHPYFESIQQLLKNSQAPDASLVAYLQDVAGRDFGQVPCCWVDTEDALDEMLVFLAAEPVIAVDLEHHSFLSYHGLTCLIQISSSTRDYLVDAIKLRESLQTAERSLNRLFADERIMKLVHGSESDIEWLQRDFDTYFVNVFDSYFAAKALSLPRCSLAYLLERYLGVELDKTYQLADWRERPLPEEMLEYARKDTHYLFGLYLKLVAELKRDQIAVVRNQSNAQCLVTFMATKADEQGWKTVLDRSMIPLNVEQRTLARALYYWRDEQVRALDISPAAFLSNSGMLKLAQAQARTVADVRKVLRHTSQWMDMNALVEFLSSYQSLTFPETPSVSAVQVVEPAVNVLAEKMPKSEAPHAFGRVSFASERPKASASSLFAKKSSAPRSAQLLSGLLSQSLPTVDAGQFTTREQAKEMEAEQERLAKEKEALEEKRVDNVPLMIHGSGQQVEHVPLLSKDESTIMQKIHSKPRQQARKRTTDMPIIPHVYSESKDIMSDVPKQVVFNPYGGLSSNNSGSKKTPIIALTIKPGNAPRLPLMPSSGNICMNFTVKKRK